MQRNQIAQLKTKIPKDVLRLLETRTNIVGLSGGKDSVATCILLHYLGIPFKTVTAEVMWNDEISGEHPLHRNFLYNVLFPKLNTWGVETEVVRGNVTAVQFMLTPIRASKEHPERNGKYRGFPLCGRCGIQRDCKTGSCEKYYKGQTEPFNVIVGLASNEKDRVLSANNKNLISLLSLLDIHEMETYSICKSEGLLSPTYGFAERGGYWFCPNQRIQELELLYRGFPELWEELMAVQKMPNKVTELFNRSQTLYDIEEQINRGVQMKIFMSELIRSDTE